VPEIAHALTAASAGVTVPFTEPFVITLNANRPAAITPNAASVNLAFFILLEFLFFKLNVDY
jgi:hypothetical protein